MSQSHLLCPSADETPAYTIHDDPVVGPRIMLSLDSAAQWVIAGPSVAYLRALEKVACELAARLEAAAEVTC